MASKSFYINVFYILFIIYPFIAETLSDSDEHFVAYDVDVPDFTHYAHTFVPLERSVRQAPTPPEKKYDSPSPEKSKTTKKPSAMDAKPTSEPGDVDQKPKTSPNKKESLSTKIVVSTLPPPLPDHDATHIHEEHEGDLETTHIHPDIHPDVSPTNATLTSSTAKLPPKKSTVPSLSNITVPDGEIEVDKFLDDVNNMELNETLRDHNITSQIVAHHLYYNSTILYHPEVFQRYWVDMDKMSDVKDILSNSHRRAVTVKLNFDFPFYGHLIKKIIIATGGFLYTGEYVHSWLSVTQYIAPLMANFDTTSSNYSSIKYVDNGTAFTVQWENVVLRNKPEDGNFTFQCTLFKNGDIVFVYKHISVVIDNSAANNHPIKVGVSDAYIIDRTIFLVRRKTIYEYHRVNIERDEIRNETVILLNALDTCLSVKDCRSCLKDIENFECNWCGNRCSNGMDRYRQEWLAKGCGNKKRKSVDECLADEEPIIVVPKSQGTIAPVDGNKNIGIAGIMGILFVICLALGVGVWLFYAYRNPHTPAGQFLIRYRPSQWSWRRGEARYTAATIHM